MINNLPQIGASFDKINLTMRHKKRRPCQRGAASQNEECRATPGTPSVCPYPPPLHRTDPVKARPAPYGGGPVHFSLDGGWAVEYPPSGANAGQRCRFRGALFLWRFYLRRGGQRFQELLADGRAVSLYPPAHLQLPPQDFDGLIDR